MKNKTKLIFSMILLVTLISLTAYSTDINDLSTSTENVDVEESLEQEVEVIEEDEETEPPEVEKPIIKYLPDISTDGYVIYHRYNSMIPESIGVNLQYDKYITSIDYVYAMNGSVNIRVGPGTYHPVIRASTWYEKFSVIEAVQGEYITKYGGDMWYKVTWEDEAGVQYGYILSAIVDLRTYQFDKMLDSLRQIDLELATHKMGFVSNYKNRSGSAPYYMGKSEDLYGNVRYQSAPAYYSLDNLSEFIYLNDGTLVSILEETDKYFRLKTMINAEEFWVPKRYINFNNGITPLTQMVVIDRYYQNQVTFEKRETNWVIVSYTLATTGADTRFKYPTPLGFFMAIEKKTKFLYLDDYTRQISGYAPYVVRFSGGAYIHGVPVEFKKWGGKLVDPGQREFSPTIGTTPRSHKCVRNYTSHAKFLYDWARIGEMGVIVIE